MSTAPQDTPAPSVTDAAEEARAARALLADRLHQAADFIAGQPELNPYAVDVRGTTVVIRDLSIQTADDLARVSRAIGGRWDKRDRDELFALVREVADGVHVELVAWREQVCTRVVTGTRQIEVEEADPEAVAALPKVTRVETVEDVEWRCEPLLAPREPQAA